jgi:hypothetical protein
VHIYTIDPLRDPRWVKFIHKAPRASVFHSREWLEALRRTYGYEPISFTTSGPEGELTNGLLFCQVRSWCTGSRIVSVPFSDHCEPLVDNAEEFSFLLNSLRASMHQQDWKYIEIRPVNGQFKGIEQAAGFAPVTSFYLHRLDLRPSVPKIFQSLNKDSVQRRIRHAESAGITFGCGRSEVLLKDFYCLFVLTRRRHNLPPQPYEWFRNLVDCMGESLEIRLAYKDASPIAGILTLRFRSTVYYKYGASDQKHHNLAAMPALLWRAIQESKHANAEEFDLGRSDPGGQGLIAFKDHWTRGRSRLVYWRYPVQSRLSERTTRTHKLVAWPFSYMPNRLLVLAGRAIYRHIG